jgi:two-component system CheB/CheR fusion protein
MPEKCLVAIGSSAGGMDPLLSFFDATPHDRATYVVLTHLPIEYKSRLQDILQLHSKLTTREITQGMPIESD